MSFGASPTSLTAETLLEAAYPLTCPESSVYGYTLTHWVASSRPPACRSALMIFRIASAFAATAASAVARRVSAPKDIRASFGIASTVPTPLTVIESVSEEDCAPARSGSPTAPARATTASPAAVRSSRRFIVNLRWIGDETSTPPRPLQVTCHERRELSPRHNPCCPHGGPNHRPIRSGHELRRRTDGDHCGKTARAVARDRPLPRDLGADRRRSIQRRSGASRRLKTPHATVSGLS